jgi:hypothetical protein
MGDTETTLPVGPAPAVDPIVAFIADQVLDEAAMLAVSTFPISSEVRELP